MRGNEAATNGDDLENYEAVIVNHGPAPLALLQKERENSPNAARTSGPLQSSLTLPHISSLPLLPGPGGDPRPGIRTQTGRTSANHHFSYFPT